MYQLFTTNPKHAIQGNPKIQTSCPASIALKPSYRDMENHVGKSSFQTGENANGT